MYAHGTAFKDKNQEICHFIFRHYDEPVENCITMTLTLINPSYNPLGTACVSQFSELVT
jgi:hypothetical protein